ncbi:MAG: beta-propeller domain-containing protein [Acutalibacteraceae bacterium]|nr:beta-propeller domain-containing protein [Acutalibacteraceae bacterium]
MKNNDILNELNSSADSFLPSDRLAPDAIEKSLSNVKRKSNKGLVTACASLAVVCLTVIGVSTVMLKSPAQQAPVIQAEVQNNSYADIYTVVKDIKKKEKGSFLDQFVDVFNGNQKYESMTDDMLVLNGESFNSAPESKAQDVTTVGSTQTAEYSDTNVQVQGVDEADVVKTDGNYIYSVRDNQIFITKPDNGTTSMVSSIQCDFDITDIYIHTGALVAISEYTTYQNGLIAENNAEESFSGSALANSFSRVYVYDLADINAPVLMSELSQSGDYLSSRKIDNILYLTTRYSIYNLDEVEEDEPETYCPVYGTASQLDCVPSESIVIGNNANEIEYVTVSSVDLNNPQSFADICSVLGSGYNTYASMNNIYVGATDYGINDDNDSTQIFRFSINGTDIEQNGSLTVDGSLLNQFSMDEYNGYFRIVTEMTDYITSEEEPGLDISGISRIISTGDTTTALYVFDSNLNMVGKTQDVAPGERVKSVRFDGDTAYFVTFRQTDPLFTVDLSNPESPQILSALKIPGFSQYLHPFGDGLLLGFGQEADPDTGGTQGLKLTMFNTSDKTNVTELATTVFTDFYANSQAQYDHKAIFVDVKNSIIGIPYYTYNDGVIHYILFKYDTQTNSFSVCQEMQIPDTLDDIYYSLEDSHYQRGLYIGDYFYIVTPQNIYSYKYLTFEEVSSLSLN